MFCWPFQTAWRVPARVMWFLKQPFWQSVRWTMETKVRCLRAPRNLFLSSLKYHRVSVPLDLTINTKNIRIRLLRPPSVSKMKSDGRHSAWSNVPLLSRVREAQGTLLATQPSCLSGLETPYAAEEQRPSCVVHMDSADSGILATRALEHGRSPAVDGDVLLQTRGNHWPFREETSNFQYKESAPVTKCFFTKRTDRWGQKHMRPTTRSSCTVPVRELALDCNSSQPSNPTERFSNFSYHDFLVVSSKVIETTRLGDFIQPLVPYKGSDWLCARCSSLSILCLLVTLSRFTRGSKMLWCLGFVSHPDWQPTFQAFTHSDPGSAKMRESMDFDSSSLVSCLAHWSDLLSWTTTSMSERHFWSLCFWNPVEAAHQLDCQSLWLPRHPAFGGAVKNIIFVLSVAVLTSNYKAKISVDDSLQHVAKFSHPASVPSSAISSLPRKLETDDSVPLCFNKRTADFGMIWDFWPHFKVQQFLLTRFWSLPTHANCTRRNGSLWKEVISTDSVTWETETTVFFWTSFTFYFFSLFFCICLLPLYLCSFLLFPF